MIQKFGAPHKPNTKLPQIFSLTVFILVVAASIYQIYIHNQHLLAAYQQLFQRYQQLSQDLETVKHQLAALEAEDQYQLNQSLKRDLEQTRLVFNQALEAYERVVDLRQPKIDQAFASVLKDLSNLQYTSASAKLAKLNADIDQAQAAAQALKGIDVASLTISNAPPQSGYQRQKVTIDGKEFVVDIVAADLNSTKVIVDTAADSDCRDNCPVLPLATYVARNGAYAGINGTYFCPASYPSCAGKTNSFDLLLMNKNKTYFNSENNVYSTNPAVIFNGSSVRFVARAQEWGRDTGVDGVLSNFPLLVFNSQTQFAGDNDPKKSSVGYRPFVANKGNQVYIGVIRGVTVAQAAQVLQAMGMDNAINLDSGGSTAFWANGGYKAGPGRDIPNAILFVRK